MFCSFFRFHEILIHTTFLLTKKVIVLRKPFQFEAKQKNEKETKIIYASAVDLLRIRIGNLNWRKCRHCKKEAREINCLICREVNAMPVALAKITEHKQSILPSRYYGQLSNN